MVKVLKRLADAREPPVVVPIVVVPVHVHVALVIPAVEGEMYAVTIYATTP